MGDEVEPSVQGLSDGYILAQAIAAAGAEYIQPAGETLLADHANNISGGSLPLNGFGANWAADSLTVTIQTGEGFIGGAFVATDDQHNVDLAASTTDQTVYVGWDFDATNTVKVGLDAAFNESDPKIAAWTFDTDASGVIDTTDERVLGPEGGGTVISDGALIGRFLATGRATEPNSTAGAEVGEIFRAPGGVADFILWVENGQGRADLTYNAYLDGGVWKAQTGTQRAFRISFSTQFGLEFASKSGDDILSAGDPIEWEPFRLRSGTIIDAEDINNPLTLYDSAAGGIPQARLNGPPGQLSGYPIQTQDISGAEGTVGEVLTTDGTEGGVTWDAAGGSGGSGWTTLETFEDTDDSTMMSFGTQALGTTYDMYRIEFHYANNLASGENWLHLRVNVDSTSAYYTSGIDMTDNTVRRFDARTAWEELAHTDEKQSAHGVITISGNEPPGSDVDTVNWPTATFDMGADQTDFLAMSGRLRQDYATVNRMRLFSEGDATGAMTLLGKNL